MACSTFFLVVIIVPMVAAISGIDWLLAENAEKGLEMKVRKEIGVEELKAEIRKALDRSEPLVVADTPRLSEAFLKLLLTENEPSLQPLQTKGSRIFFPANNNLQCLWHNTSSCRRFEYRISESVKLHKWELWFYKLKSLQSTHQIVSITCEPLDKEQYEKKELETLLYEEGEEMWLSVNLPFTKELNQWNGKAICTVEVTGMTVGEEQGQPFFKMTKTQEIHPRKRRSEEDPSANETCRSTSLLVSFDEIGFGDLILYPKNFYINLCDGFCNNNIDVYDAIVERVLQGNQTIDKQFGRCWVTCCRPKEYEALNVILKEDKTDTDMYEFRFITIMVVKSCSCG